jgi:hypothetical protein
VDSFHFALLWDHHLPESVALWELDVEYDFPDVQHVTLQLDGAIGLLFAKKIYI